MTSSFINPAFSSSFAASGLGGFGGFRGPSLVGSGSFGAFGGGFNSFGGGFGGFGGGGFGGLGGGFGAGIGGFGVPGFGGGLYGGSTASAGGGFLSGIANAFLQRSFAMGQLRAQETVLAAQEAWANAGAYAMTNTPPTQVERFF